MHYLLLIGAIIWFAFIAPLKITLITSLFVLLSLTIVRFTTQAVTGDQVTFGEAAKAVSLSFIFLAIVIFTLISFSYGLHGVSIHIAGLAAYVIFGATLVAYIFGYRMGLGISFGASAIIALISSVASVVTFMLIRSLL